jgi:UV DNA damage endonuclease
MLIRFGYVAMALNILDGSPNKTITHTNLLKINTAADRFKKLRKLTKTNLDCLLRVLKYNKFQHIHVFRITSKLIPLATHPITKNWDYLEEFKEQLAEIGTYIRQNKMRVSAHPDHFTLLNSPDETVVNSSIDTLTYHAKLFEMMGLDNNAKLVLHIGGAYKDKASAAQRFITNYNQLPVSIKGRIILENDDKIFTAKDTLQLCKIIKAPMVTDIHHHDCCNDGETLQNLWPDILKTWNHALPKIHFSSPKSDKKYRAHADFIDPEQFFSFLQQVKIFNCDFDVMIEAKQKDKALFQLIDDLKNQFKINMIDDTTIEL